MQCLWSPVPNAAIGMRNCNAGHSTSVFLNILESGGHTLIHGKWQSYNLSPHVELPQRVSSTGYYQKSKL